MSLSKLEFSTLLLLSRPLRYLYIYAKSMPSMNAIECSEMSIGDAS